jgi:hypothetical protein
LSMGGHIGYKATSTITSNYQHANSSAPVQDPPNRSQRSLYYCPFIFDFYVGLRL